jgi:hypothetical protein
MANSHYVNVGVVNKFRGTIKKKNSMISGRVIMLEQQVDFIPQLVQ